MPLQTDAPESAQGVTPWTEPAEGSAPDLRYPKAKRTLDVVLASTLLIALSPLILALMALVRLTSRGPALYSQVRLGLNGQPFRIYKLRSMTHDCEQFSGPMWAKPRDSRVTWLGRILRATHLDELPQLFNVVRGDMSLVGPRPERPEFVVVLERVIPEYRARLEVRPGVTGLAQVQLPPDTDTDSVRRKVERDLYYIERMSWLLDLKILAATATKVVGVPCPLACRLLGIPTGEPALDASAEEAGLPLAAGPV